MTERLEHALDAVEEHLRTMKAIPARDPREPGRTQKHKAESRLIAVVQRHFRKQRAAIMARLESFPPVQAQKTTLQYNFDTLLDDPEWLPSIMRLMLQFVTDGIALSSELFGITIDYTLTNTAAAEWARKYAGEFIKGIDNTTLDVVRQAVSDFASTPGMTVGDIEARLPFDATRAEMISTTEVTRSYAQANTLMGEQLKGEFPDVMVVTTWYTNNDDKVCDICGPLEGQEVEIGEMFAGDIDAPPAHVNCRCWTQVRTRING